MTITQPVPSPSKHWQRTLYVLFIAQVCTSIGFSSIFPFLPLYVKELGSSAGLNIEFLSGLVFSAQAFTMMIASPFWGAMADRYGRKLMVERAMLGGAVILLLMAFVRSAEQLVLLRAVQGLITGTIAASNALVASVVPRRQTGYAMGLLQVGLGSGVALGPLIGGAVADSYGYSAAFYVTSALLLVGGLLVWWGVVERFEKVVPRAESTQRAESTRKAGRQTGMPSKWGSILRTPGVIPTYSMRFVCQLGRWLIIPIAPLFIQTLLTDASRLNTFTGLVVGAASATTTFSSIILGRLGDRTGHRLIIVFSALAAAGLYFLHCLVRSGWQLLVLQALVGVALGGIIPAISALLATFTKPDEVGVVYGLDNSIDAAGRTVAPMVGSAIAISIGLRSTFFVTALLFIVISMVATWRLPKTSQWEGKYRLTDS
jgi:DHA1 family multidrug resistance protein-like MFS transporter